MNKLIVILWITTTLFSSMVEVSVTTPKQVTKAVTIEADGVVIAKNKILITSKATGIVKLYVDNNTNVSKGDKIAQIVDERREQKIQFFKTKIALVKNEIKSQTIKLLDAKEMFHMGVGSKNNYLNEQLLTEQLKENFQTLDAEYKILQSEQKNSLIYAIDDGTITNLIPLNSYINYGMRVATLLSKERYVKLFIDVTYANNLKKGNSVKVQNNYKNTEAIIANILPTSSSNLIEVIVITDELLPLNMQVNATVELTSIKGMSIPKSAIVLVQNHPAVYIVKGGIAHLQYIEILKDMVEDVLIKESFDKDTQVVTKNSYMLHDNLVVRVK